VAVTVVLPAANAVTVAGSPPTTEAVVGVPVVQLAVEETSTGDPLEMVAKAVKVLVEFTVMVAEVGLIVRPVTLPRTTLAVVLPLTAPEVAVTVVDPVATPVSRPPVVMLAIVLSELDQHTVFPLQLVPPASVLLELSLKTPVADIC
jgi:hypothetical protein